MFLGSSLEVLTVIIKGPVYNINITILKMYVWGTKRNYAPNDVYYQTTLNTDEVISLDSLQN